MRWNLEAQGTLRAFAMLALLFVAGSALAASNGVLEEITGNVSIVSTDGKARKAQAKDDVQSGDTIRTEGKSEAFVKMQDESTFILRPNTQFKIVEFKYEEKKSTDTSLVSLLTGTVRMISGLIGKYNRSQVRVNTPTATIGIRGTDFEVAVVPEGSDEARAGVYDYVREGETNIQLASNSESLDVPKDKTGFAPDKLQPGEAPLQLLAEPPAFLLQGGGLDAIVQSLMMAPTNIIQHIPMFR